MNLKTGDILLKYDDKLISEIIEFGTQAKYSHVAMVYDYPLIIHSHWSPGVHITHIDTLSNFDTRRVEGLLKNHTKKEIKDVCQKYLGRKYGKMEIFEMWVKGYILGDNYLNSPDKIFCSELIDLILTDLGYNLKPDLYIGDLSPQHCAKSPIYKYHN